MNIANMISIMKIGMVPIILFSIFNYTWEVTLMLFLIASIFDGLDGYVARKYGLVSRQGALLDSIGDKIMILSLAIAFFFKFDIPVLYIIMILFRDICVVIAVTVVKIFVGKSKRLTFSAKRSGKNVTLMQFITLGAILLDLPYIKYLVYLTFIFGIWCLADYWYEWKKKVSIKDIDPKKVIKRKSLASKKKLTKK